MPKNMSLHATTRPPCRTAARSTSPRRRSNSQSGTTSPCTRRRATPPSGKIRSRTCEAWALRTSVTGKRLCESPRSGLRGTTSCQLARARSYAAGAPGIVQTSSAHDSGKLPLKCVVSTSMPRTTPSAPRWTMHQSCARPNSGSPGKTSRRRRVSQPSIHLPRSVYSPSRHTGASSLSRRSFGAKNSSLAATTDAPRRSDARSTRSREVHAHSC